LQMKSKVVASLTRRIATEVDSQLSLKFLKDVQVADYVSVIISVVYLYTRPKRGNHASIYLAEIIAALGHGVRNKLKLKRDSGFAAKLGTFILYTFEELGYLRVMLGQGSKRHATYIVEVTDDEAIVNMWNSLEPSQISKLPSETPYAPWITSRHVTGLSMVKTGNKEVIAGIRLESHPILFNVLNKAQAVGWTVNKDVYDLHSWALRNKTDAFADIWEQQNPEAKVTKLREARAIGDIARRFLGKVFYHSYYYDFRGRKYPTSAYFHEQGSDLARGMLLRADRKAIRKEGLFWLFVSIASNWAGDAGRQDGLKTDKIPLLERFAWVSDNEEIILSYAEKPKVNQGWMQADKPWQFIAACFELKKLREWQFQQGKGFENYEYESGLEAYIDGTNNGCQHLAALTRDEVTAPHVNLVPLDFPGDLYRYVGEHVWKHVRETVKLMPEDVVEGCEQLIDNLVDLKKQINSAEHKSDRRAELVAKILEFKKSNEFLLSQAAPVFWNRIHDLKHIRKIVKRNTMTLPYGGTSFGLGEQQITDARKHGIDALMFMEHRWGAFMGRAVFEDCRRSMERPMKLLSVFEKAGKVAEDTGKFLSWTTPITNFPVVQNYTEGVVKKIWVQYGPPKGEKLSTGYYVNTLQISICFIEQVVPSKGKQSQGASPNAIHSLDATHLAMTVDRCDFPVTTIHDSFGALLCDMPSLFKTVRQTFVELYEAKPLESLLKDIGGDINEVDIGSLDVSLVLDSEYCFS